MKKHDNNVDSTITRDPREMTPFERHAAGLEKAAYIMRIHKDTEELIKRLEELEELAEDLPLPLETLQALADEAIIGLAQDLEARYGICA